MPVKSSPGRGRALRVSQQRWPLPEASRSWQVLAWLAMSCEISIHDMIVHIVHLCSLGCLILFNVVYVSEIVRRHVTPYHIGLLTHGFEAIETVCIFPWLSMAFHGFPWLSMVDVCPRITRPQSPRIVFPTAKAQRGGLWFFWDTSSTMFWHFDRFFLHLLP